MSKYLQIIVRLDEDEVERNSDLILYRKSEGGEYEYNEFLFAVDDYVSIDPGPEEKRGLSRKISGNVIFLETHSDEDGEVIWHSTQQRLSR